MSRAININATREQAVAACAKHKVPISAIETLHSGGTRIVHRVLMPNSPPLFCQ